MSEARIRANHKYNTKAYYRPFIALRREYEPLIRERAKELNMTMSGYILSLIKKDLNIEEDSAE